MTRSTGKAQKGAISSGAMIEEVKILTQEVYVMTGIDIKRLSPQGTPFLLKVQSFQQVSTRKSARSTVGPQRPLNNDIILIGEQPFPRIFFYVV